MRSWQSHVAALTEGTSMAATINAAPTALTRRTVLSNVTA
jgi:hypothetical protein